MWWHSSTMPCLTGRGKGHEWANEKAYWLLASVHFVGQLHDVIQEESSLHLEQVHVFYNHHPTFFLLSNSRSKAFSFSLSLSLFGRLPYTTLSIPFCTIHILWVSKRDHCFWQRITFNLVQIHARFHLICIKHIITSHTSHIRIRNSLSSR